MDRQTVARLVDALDHPDAVHQREVMDLLVDAGAAVIEPLVANLNIAPPRARNCVVRVLGELGDSSAILPLMRFVFDRSDSIEDRDARGLAMRALTELTDETTPAARMFQFLLDVYQDDDPFVRGYALTMLGRFGDRRAVPIVEDALRDEVDFVRERAEAAVEQLRSKSADGPDESVDDEELLQAIRGRQGGERRYYLNDLRERPNAFELAERLVSEGGRGVIAGLEYMLQADDPRARATARRYAARATRPDELAICLRVLNRFIAGDATDDEVALIRGALYHGDSFVRLAALEAAGRSGDPTMIERAVDATRSDDLDRRHAAACGLAAALSPEHRKVLPELMQAFELANARRLAVVTPDTVRIEAYLVRAIRRIVASGGYGTSRAQEIALTALEGALDHRPLIVTAFELLDATTPADGFQPDRRWSPQLSRNLADILAHPDDGIRDRALDLLVRGAPPIRGILPALQNVIFDRNADIVGKVIPLVEAIGDDDARRVLTDLGDEDDEAIRQAAQSALKRLRNADEVFDAEFEDPLSTAQHPRGPVVNTLEDDEF